MTTVQSALHSKSKVQFLTERKQLTGSKDTVTAWIRTDLSLALPRMLGPGRLAKQYIRHLAAKGNKNVSL